MSVIDSSSPAGLGHAGDVALVRELAQAKAAEAELPVVGTRPPAPAAAVIGPALVLRLSPLLDDLRGLCHLSAQAGSVQEGGRRGQAESAGDHPRSTTHHRVPPASSP